MSNKTQLQANNTALDSLITRVNAAKDVAASLPEAGSGGGESVETCAVVVNISNYTDIFYTAYIDGEFQHLHVNSSAPVQLSNVVINTNIVIVCPQITSITITGSVKQNESVTTLFGGSCCACLLSSESTEGGSITISERFD